MCSIASCSSIWNLKQIQCLVSALVQMHTRKFIPNEFETVTWHSISDTSHKESNKDPTDFYKLAKTFIKKIKVQIEMHLFFMHHFTCLNIIQRECQNTYFQICLPLEWRCCVTKGWRFEWKWPWLEMKAWQLAGTNDSLWHSVLSSGEPHGQTEVH